MRRASPSNAHTLGSFPIAAAAAAEIACIIGRTVVIAVTIAADHAWGR